VTDRDIVLMEFASKFAIAVADDLAQWQKLNIVAFLTSGVLFEVGKPVGTVRSTDANDSG